MRKQLTHEFPRGLLAAMLLFSSAALAQNAEPELKPVQHEFVIMNFKTESGVVLPEAHVVYGTFGTLNASGDNAVLLPSHYMADMNGYRWVIGPAKALDPGKQFLVTSELFGNGRSSSPSPIHSLLHAGGDSLVRVHGGETVSTTCERKASDNATCRPAL